MPYEGGYGSIFSPALHTRRSVPVKGLIAAAVAFVIGVGAVYAVEKVIGNSLSCGLWSNCPKELPLGYASEVGTGANPTINLGRAMADTATPQNGTQNPLQPQKH